MTINPHCGKCESAAESLHRLWHDHMRGGEITEDESAELVGRCLANATLARDLYEEAKLVGYIEADGPRGPVRVYFAFMEMWKDVDSTRRYLKQARTLHTNIAAK